MNNLEYFVPDAPKPRYYPDLNQIINNLDVFIDKLKNNFNQNPIVMAAAEHLEQFKDHKNSKSLDTSKIPILKYLIGQLLSTVYPGHSAIVHYKNGVKSIVEAWGEPPNCVRLLPMGDWYDLNVNYTGGPYDFWLGRLSGASIAQRAQISEYAHKRLNVKFNFFNFDLSDKSSFYCSKLAWMAIYDATKIAIDGLAQTNRVYWVSPKDLIECEGIDIIKGERSKY